MKTIKDEIEIGEIVYCDLHLKNNNKTVIAKGVVYKKTDGYFSKKSVLNKFNSKEPLLVVGVDIIKRMGFESKSKGFTEVKASNEKRNKITGAYE